MANATVVNAPPSTISVFGSNAVALDIVGSATDLTILNGNVTDEGGILGATVSGASTLRINGGSVSNLFAQAGSSVFSNSGTLTDVSVSSGASLGISAGGSLSSGFHGMISDAGALSNASTIFVDPARDRYSAGTTLDVALSGNLLNTGIVSVAGGTVQGPGVPAPGGALVVEGTVTNQGTVTIGGGGGRQIAPYGPTAPSGTLDVDAGGSFNNQGLLAAGSVGSNNSIITVHTGGTLTNSGTLSIAPSSGAVVQGTLVLDPGQVTTGIVGGSYGSTLELASGTGTLAGLGSTYIQFNTVQVDPGANWTLAGGTLEFGSTLKLGLGSTLTLSNDFGSSSMSTISFQGGSTLAISQTGYSGIVGFDTGSVIDAAGSQAGNTVFALASDDATINLADDDNPYTLRFLGDSGRHLQLRQSQSLTGTLTLEPVATAIVAHPDMAGTLAAGDVITFDLTPETALSVDTTTGLPTLALSNGGTATYDQTASTSTNLVFRTTVGGGQGSSDLTVTGLSLAGASVVDAVGTTFDVSSVATLAGSNTGIVISSPVTIPPTTPTPPTTVTGGVTVIGGAGGTVFITPKAGSNSVTATATGNDTVISQGTDTIQAGGGADVVYATGAAATVAGGTGGLTFEGGSGNYMVVGGSGSSAIYGGAGSNTFFGGTGPSILVAGSGASNLLLAGVGNATLVGGLGKAVMMFGGPGTDSFTGSSGGNDIMVGGAGGNSFSLTGGDVAFGGPIKADTFTAGNGAAMIITGGGGAQVNLGSGTLTSFEGSGAVNYNAGKGESGTTDIVGFTVHDHITLTGGFTAQDASTAFSTATKGSFGTTLNLTDGTKITVFGVNLTATQVSVG